MDCPQCGRPNYRTARVCKHCFASLPPPEGGASRRHRPRAAVEKSWTPPEAAPDRLRVIPTESRARQTARQGRWRGPGDLLGWVNGGEPGTRLFRVLALTIPVMGLCYVVQSVLYNIQKAADNFALDMLWLTSFGLLWLLGYITMGLVALIGLLFLWRILAYLLELDRE